MCGLGCVQCRASQRRLSTTVIRDTPGVGIWAGCYIAPEEQKVLKKKGRNKTGENGGGKCPGC